jgi:hypothetical protein
MSAANDPALNFRNDMIGIIRNKTGMHLSIAVPVAEAIIEGMRERFGGMYIPKREILDVRDEAIRAKFKGNNHDQLVKEFGISRAQIYRIVQPSLSNPGAGAAPPASPSPGADKNNPSHFQQK